MSDRLSGSEAADLYAELQGSASAHACREQALAAQVELLTHRLVEARMVVMVQAQHIADQERRMAEMGR